MFHIMYMVKCCYNKYIGCVFDLENSVHVCLHIKLCFVTTYAN